MALAKITLYGMTRWMENEEDDLFEYLSLPTGMDKDTLIDVIMLRGAEFGVLYADPYFMQTMIGIWSEKHQHTFERWVKALSIDYNPLENYDRFEDWTDAGNRQRSDTGSGAEQNAVTMAANESTSNNQTTDTVTGENDKMSSTDTNQVSAYDAGSSLQNKEKTIHESTDSKNGITHTGTDGGTTVDGHTQSVANRQHNDNRSENEQSANVRHGRAHGNIGVTTSQQMLEAEWNVARLNIYNEAAELFLEEFCIYVY